MGYISQSNTKKIHAYLTQTGKEKLITGNTTDFQVNIFHYMMMILIIKLHQK